MEFTIVIASFNGPERVGYLLESIFKFYPKANPAKIIVSDDCSPRMEETRKIAVEKYGVIFTHSPEWAGVGGNWNHAISLSEDNLVFVIDDDLLISKGSLETMQKFWEDNQHLKMGGVGFTFIQSSQLVENGIIPNVAGFYPPVWNSGEISYNACKFKRPTFGMPFLKPIVCPTPSPPCCSISKIAWEECGRCHEFGMQEGGVYHTMWEKGWAIVDIPTPSLFHRVGMATSDESEFLKTMYKQNPEKIPNFHKLGDEMYKKARGRGYYDDAAYLWKEAINPQKVELLKSIKYNFDAKGF